jgi:hypothetical protein
VLLLLLLLLGLLLGPLEPPYHWVVVVLLHLSHWYLCRWQPPQLPPQRLWQPAEPPLICQQEHVMHHRVCPLQCQKRSP